MSAIPSHYSYLKTPIIRRARISDVSEIFIIERASFIEPWEPETLTQSIEWFPNSCFVAECKGHIIAFLIGSPQQVSDGFYGHICNLAVMDTYRKLGIGRLLIRRAEHQFMVEGALGIQLEVRESNSDAREFYQKLGYSEVFVFPRYYSNEENAIVMMKWFQY